MRMDKRMVKVLKALAELYDLSLGQLLEDLVRGAFAGRQPFSDDARARIAELMAIYGLDPTSLDTPVAVLDRHHRPPPGAASPLALAVELSQREEESGCPAPPQQAVGPPHTRYLGRIEVRSQLRRLAAWSGRATCAPSRGKLTLSWF